MKRTFLAKRNLLLSSAGISWGFFALSGVMFVLLVRLFAPNIFWFILAPVFHGADTLAAQTHIVFSSFSDAAALTLQNEQLMNENAVLSNENQALIAKTNTLSALFSSPAIGSNKTSGILAGVVAHPPESPYDTLVLAAGTNAGIILGMEAFGMGGVPLGVISSVFDDFSYVTLFSAPNMVTHGWVGHANVPLAIVGSGAGVMSASLSRSANIMVGDMVFAPGPGALPIGSITRIDNDPTAPEVLLRVTPMVNLFSITWVVVRDTGIRLPNAFLIATSTL